MDRAAKAQATLDSDFIKSAFHELRDACFTVIKSSAPTEGEQREDMYYLLRAIDYFEKLLKKHIETAKIEDLQKHANIKRILR